MLLNMTWGYCLGILKERVKELPVYIRAYMAVHVSAARACRHHRRLPARRALPRARRGSWSSLPPESEQSLHLGNVD